MKFGRSVSVTRARTVSILALSGFSFMVILVGRAVLGAGNPEPLPSPLFKKSLLTSVEELKTPQLTARPKQLEPQLAAVPHPEQLTPALSLGRSLSAAAQVVTIEDCYFGQINLFMSNNPSDQNCNFGFSAFGQGTCVVGHGAPPYTNGVDIPTEMISMNLVGNSSLGPVTIRERLDRTSAGEVNNVVTDGGGNFQQGLEFFDVFFEIEIPSQGVTLHTGNQPIRITSPTISSLPPIGTQYTSQSGQGVQLFDASTGNPWGWVCFTEHYVNSSTDCNDICWCVVELSCASGPANQLAQLGICVGDLRRSDQCACINGTCAVLYTRIGNVCLEWTPVACTQSSFPFIPAGDACACQAGPTMPSSPSCPGQSTCPPGVSCSGAYTCPGSNTCQTSISCGTTPTCVGSPSCPRSSTCAGTSTCQGSASCPGTPSCPGVSSCPGFGLTCPWGPTCPETYGCFYWTSASAPTCGGGTCYYSASCYGGATCFSTPSCPADISCQSFATCDGFLTCAGTETCSGSPSCGTVLSEYPVVFSVEGPVNPSEGLLVPGHPEPNDIYALGPIGTYLIEGELFQSSSGGLPGTNLDRVSGALGVGPAPFGPPPYHGPFAPNAGAPLPDPPPPGGLGTLGLLPGDDVDGLSFGNDGGNILLFSVTPLSVGLPGTGVHFESKLSPPAAAIGPFPPSNGGGDPGEEAAGDIFRSGRFGPFGGGIGTLVTPADVAGNALEVDEVELGLQAPAVSWAIPQGFAEDDLDALETSDASDIDPDFDGIPEGHTYFTLDSNSVSILAGLADPFPGVSTAADPDGVTPDDILIAPPPGGPYFSYAIFARGVVDIGLLDGDDLDALALWDSPPLGVLNAGDEFLFSLSGGSPSLAAGANPNMPAGALSPGDVYLKTVAVAGISRYADASDLGLFDADDVDAIDVANCACSATGAGDIDADGFANGCDNCASLFNPSQADDDRDGVGNICDACIEPAVPVQTPRLRTGGVLPRDIRLDVTNHGQFGSTDEGQGSFWRYADSSRSLFDASVLVAHGPQTPDTTVFRRFFFNVASGQFGYQPIAPIAFDTSAYGTGTGYVTATADMVTRDCQIGVTVDWMFPQHSDSDEFVLARYTLTSFSSEAISDLAVGVIADIDVVPALRYGQIQFGLTNSYASDAGLQLVWQRGVDTAGHIIVGTRTATRFRAGMLMISPHEGTWTGSNAIDLFPQNGATDGFLYDVMQNVIGHDYYGGSPTDLYTMAVFGRGQSLTPGGSLQYCLAFLSDTLSEASFKATAAKAQAAGLASLCAPDICECDCHGNPACSGGVIDVLDVVNVIGSAFRNQPATPDPNSNCPYLPADVDCDGIITVIDVVKMVNVAFRNASTTSQFCDPCP